ncbi:MULTISPECIES: heavy metal-responsive transcriptional regulator [Auritidibacter]|uniref:heavy metal-responsive transcriptional regulator n=1 Tax=Auritidibacter TaxID=1160973 RepID=UPI000D73FBB7|nr:MULTISPECIES: heavy metal-responsive transcriptional regulator [Auritidibacter]PXA77214.1 heavy metal-responsive transcriptional regulator [Auritidibacter sp. NML100628]WGH84769.1 heavy metal-responsive transcriptional regulator [Auritidibacter ignavus]WGH91755.1 heavy metal-responsive transcriptional regulator [Auritidibacter ignavus]
MRIGELADAADTTTKTLRYYEAIGLLPPPDRAPNGYRDYPEAMLWRLDFIRRGQRAGLSLAHIGEILRMRDTGQPPCAHVDALLANRLTELDQQIADLIQLRQTVTALHHTSRATDPATCHAEAICTNL